MAITKRIVCLANSRKPQGRCIAGREWAENRPGAWIRPVSSRLKEAVSEYERQYEDGRDPRVLDIIEVPLLEHRPKSYQSENWLLDRSQRWRKTGRVSLGEIGSFVDPISSLWINDDSSYNGCNDRIGFEQAQSLNSSLRFIRVSKLILSVSRAYNNSKGQIRGRFSHAGDEYELRVTDPECESKYLKKPYDNYPIGECFLTISLGETFKGYCYKLIAAIIRA